MEKMHIKLLAQIGDVVVSIPEDAFKAICVALEEALGNDRIQLDPIVSGTCSPYEVDTDTLDIRLFSETRDSPDEEEIRDLINNAYSRRSEFAHHFWVLIPTERSVVYHQCGSVASRSPTWAERAFFAAALISSGVSWKDVLVKYRKSFLVVEGGS